MEIDINKKLEENQKLVKSLLKNKKITKAQIHALEGKMTKERLVEVNKLFEEKMKE